MTDSLMTNYIFYYISRTSYYIIPVEEITPEIKTLKTTILCYML